MDDSTGYDCSSETREDSHSAAAAACGTEVRMIGVVVERMKVNLIEQCWSRIRQSSPSDPSADRVLNPP